MTSSLFQKSLSDIVKGIRNHKKNEREYVQGVIHDCKEDFRSTDPKVKCVAVQKCAYLAMIGYDMEWAAFRVVEVMADPEFGRKRLGYLAATQCFSGTTDVLPLTTHLFKKDMQSTNQYEAGLALSTLANVCTPDLARDLVSDVVGLLGSGRAYIRKKVVLSVFKIFLQFPDALRPTFPRLKEKLDDSDPGVIAATVNTICELARKNPGNYLVMAPQFFKLLTTVQNNWTLIKIVKLFGALTPLEPRLAKKLVDPLTNIINTTPAKSLLYECLTTITIGLTKYTGILKLALEKLKGFVEDRDQNLKYLGLLGLYNIMKFNPKYLSDMRETVIGCLGDEDVTIRCRALELIVGMVTKKNIQGIVGRLTEQVSQHEGDYKNELIHKIIELCKQNNFEHITNFEWYLRVLMDLVQTEIKNVRHGKALAGQFMDICIRVKAIREFGVRCMFSVLSSSNIFTESLDTTRSNMYEVLSSAAWLCGEFVEKVKDVKALLEALSQPAVKGLPPRVQAVFVVAVTKVYIHVLNHPDQFPEEQQKEFKQQVLTSLVPYLRSSDVEVQERATQTKKMVQMHAELLAEGDDIAPSLMVMYEDELLPVGENTQRKVPVPEGLDLESQIIEPPESEPSDDEDDETPNYGDFTFNDEAAPGTAGYQSSPYLLGGGGEPGKKKKDGGDEDIPEMKELAKGELELYGMAGWKGKDKKKGRKGKKGSKKTKEEEAPEPIVVAGVLDLPEGVVEEEKPDPKKKETKTSRKKGAAFLHEYAENEKDSLDAKLNVDLSAPLGADDVLPQIQAYKREDPNEILAKQMEDEKAQKASKKAGKKKGKGKKGDDDDDADGGKKKGKKKKGKKDKDKDDDEGEKKEKKTKKTKKADKTEEKEEKKEEKEKKGKSTKKTKEKDAEKEKPAEKTKEKKSKSAAGSADEPSDLATVCFSSEKLQIWYELGSVTVSEANDVEISLSVKNLTDASVDVNNWKLNETINLKTKKTPTAMSVGSKAVVPTTIALSCKDIQRTQEMDAQVSCAGEINKFKIPITCSLFISPTKISKADYDGLLKDGKLSKSTKTITIPANIDSGKALVSITKTLRVRPVEKPTEMAYLYGKSTGGHHACVIVKAVSDWEIYVEVWCSEGSMGTALIKEVQGMFKVKDEKPAAGTTIDDLFA
eukprot:TRINITY_DN65931_c11_g1_i1.p1 TRINITY_DN65931_c11_g1~~TRINITY_DN65931_c11_g1_i1.p1  ORF type:complete len:1157 (+),score=279.43 TRINITY_DN65931_c11_g1_i1:72-3542(+)